MVFVHRFGGFPSIVIGWKPSISGNFCVTVRSGESFTPHSVARWATSSEVLTTPLIYLTLIKETRHKAVSTPNCFHEILYPLVIKHGNWTSTKKEVHRWPNSSILPFIDNFPHEKPHFFTKSGSFQPPLIPSARLLAYDLNAVSCQILELWHQEGRSFREVSLRRKRVV